MAAAEELGGLPWKGGEQNLQAVLHGGGSAALCALIWASNPSLTRLKCYLSQFRQYQLYACRRHWVFLPRACWRASLHQRDAFWTIPTSVFLAGTTHCGTDVEDDACAWHFWNGRFSFTRIIRVSIPRDAVPYPVAYAVFAPACVLPGNFTGWRATSSARNILPSIALLNETRAYR